MSDKRIPGGAQHALLGLRLVAADRRGEAHRGLVIISRSSSSSSSSNNNIIIIVSIAVVVVVVVVVVVILIVVVVVVVVVSLMILWQQIAMEKHIKAMSSITAGGLS